MNGIIYDIFIKGVVPLAIVGVLGYAAKKFMSLQGEIRWKIASFSVIAAILLGGLYFQYLTSFSPYRAQFIPETINVPGSSVKTDMNRSYWEVIKKTPISLPLLVKRNREISVYLEIDKAPLSIEYHAERGTHKVILENVVAPLFERKATEELQGKRTHLSDSISKFDERILIIKLTTDADAKIYSFTVERDYSSIRNWTMLVLTSFIWLIPSLAGVKFMSRLMHNKKIQPTAKSGG